MRALRRLCISLRDTWFGKSGWCMRGVIQFLVLRVVRRGYARGWGRLSDTYSTPTEVGFGGDWHDPAGRLAQALIPISW
jgi:hypothetical protein